MEKETKWRVIQKHMMTGIGYMIPIVVASSLLQAVAKTIGSVMGIDVGSEVLLESSNMFIQLLAWVNQVAAPGFQNIMYVVLGGYIAYSIADRNGIAVGMLAGYIASSGDSGFIGALVGGFAAGYFIQFISGKIKVGRQWRTLMMFMIYPLIGGLFILLVMFFIIEPAGGAINNFFIWFINTVGAYGTIPLYFVIAGMMAADCGGPINKAAFSIGFTLAGTGYALTPVTQGAMIAPLGFGLAVLLDKFVLRKELFDDDLSGSGISSFVMGLFNITEGAIPLLLSDPAFMLPVNIIGSGLGAVSAYLFGAETYLGGPSGNILGWFAQPNPITWVLSLFIGAGFIALMIILRRGRLTKKVAIAQPEAVTE